MNIKELTEKEYKSTFSEKMDDVTSNKERMNEEVVDIWEYVELLEKPKYFIDKDIVEEGFVKYVYRNSANTYDHVLIQTLQNNIFLVIIVSIKTKSIFGHYLLDLNKEYGIDD
jgi:hypothetical protein